MKSNLFLCLVASAVCLMTGWPAQGQKPGHTKTPAQPPDKLPDGAKPLTRLVLQDQHDCTVRWLDVFSTRDGKTGITNQPWWANSPHWIRNVRNWCRCVNQAG